MTGEPTRPTVGAVLRDLAARPRHYLVSCWNWKSAVMSAVIRGVIFFVATVRSGFDAATAAFAIEFVFRAVTSGFFSSVTQAFRRATPDWAATLVVVAGLPFIAHVLEYGVHWIGGTERLGRAMAASVGFTVVSAAFTLYVMRRGALLVGDEDDRPFRQDLAAMPRLIAGFTAGLARGLWRLVTRPWRSKKNHPAGRFMLTSDWRRPHDLPISGSRRQSAPCARPRTPRGGARQEAAGPPGGGAAPGRIGRRGDMRCEPRQGSGFS